MRRIVTRNWYFDVLWTQSKIKPQLWKDPLEGHRGFDWGHLAVVLTKRKHR